MKTQKIRLASLVRFGLQASLAVLDQGAFSGANFIANILLARWLSQTDYGIFAVGMAMVQFGYQFQGSLVLEPMSVLGPAKALSYLRDYIRMQRWAHYIVTTVAGLGVIMVSLFLMHSDEHLGYAVVAAGAFLPLVLYPWYVRRAFYILKMPGYSVLVSILYAGLLLSTIWAFNALFELSVIIVFAIYAGSSYVGSQVLYSLEFKIKEKNVQLSEIVSDNWMYGKWLSLSAVFVAIAAQIPILVVGTMLGLSDAGAFKAMQNIIQLPIIIFFAISAFFLPLLSYEFGQGNLSALIRKGTGFLLLLFLIAAFFWGGLSGWGVKIINFVYASKISNDYSTLGVLALIPIAAAPTYSFYFLLQALQKSKAIMQGSAFWGLGSIIFSLVFTKLWGLWGSVLSVLTGYILASLLFTFLFIKQLRKESLKLRK